MTTQITSNEVRRCGCAGLFCWMIKFYNDVVASGALQVQDEVLELFRAKDYTLKQTSKDMKKKARIRFEAISDAGTSVFVQKFDDINRIYNHRSSICFDAERIYLLEC